MDDNEKVRKRAMKSSDKKSNLISRSLQYELPSVVGQNTIGRMNPIHKFTSPFSQSKRDVNSNATENCDPNIPAPKHVNVYASNFTTKTNASENCDPNIPTPSHVNGPSIDVTPSFVKSTALTSPHLEVSCLTGHSVRPLSALDQNCLIHDIKADGQCILSNASSRSDKKTMIFLFEALYLGLVDKMSSVMQQQFPELGVVKDDYFEVSWLEAMVYFSGFDLFTPPEILLNITVLPRPAFKSNNDCTQVPLPIERWSENVILEDLYSDKLAFAALSNPIEQRVVVEEILKLEIGAEDINQQNQLEGSRPHMD
ncbi:hypothetical protein POM88_048921 [Heracleum sosnowskyi]|uniref:Uncharacterized protein n=1 Tax=Heracleum sosnowskyi TaxID=360622 RepID=A0AAD8LZ05_9APIA|nr:hypothetical protein POM88_048921 [Heracleum sosnowskyi]